MKKADKFWIALFILVGLIWPTGVVAQSDEEVAAKYNISFPVAELGGCGSIGECKAYCGVEANQEACKSFAASRGLPSSKNSQGQGQGQGIVEAAKAQLGCQSQEECRSFCSQEENREKCQSFAQSHGIGQQSEAIQKAQEQLGCSSKESCREFCNQEQNRDQCQSVAQSVGLQRLKEIRESSGQVCRYPLLP